MLLSIFTIALSTRFENGVAKETLAVTGVCPSDPSVRQEPPRFGAGQGFLASRDNGIDGSAVRGGSGGNILSGRDAGGAGFGALFTHAFVVDEEEGFVALNWTTQRSPKLIIVKRILRRTDLVEKIAGVESVVAEKLEARSVKIIGAALGNDVDHAAGAAAIFGFKIGKHAQLGDGFDGQNGRG